MCYDFKYIYNLKITIYGEIIHLFLDLYICYESKKILILHSVLSLPKRFYLLGITPDCIYFDIGWHSCKKKNSAAKTSGQLTIFLPPNNIDKNAIQA